MYMTPAGIAFREELQKKMPRLYSLLSGMYFEN